MTTRAKSSFVQPPEELVARSRMSESGRWERVYVAVGGMTYHSALANEDIVIPDRFVSDGASVPRPLWWLFPPFGRYLWAAIVHDWLCKEGAKGRCRYNHKQAAAIFREAMRVLGVGAVSRNAMYFAVRWFGPKFAAKQTS